MRKPSAFVCSKCGECCRGLSQEMAVILFPNDVENISMKLGLSVDSFQKQFCHKEKLETKISEVWLAFLKLKNDKCIFLSDDNLCSIHAFKPTQCKEKPFNFFWDKSLSVKYECMKETDIPSDWNTYSFDRILIEFLKI